MLLLSADEDELYCMFFRAGKQLPWFKLGAPRKRRGKERDKLAVRANSLATRCDGHLEFHPQTVLDEVVSHGPDKGFRLAGRTNGKPVSWDVERVIANVGYRADLRISDGLRVHEPTGAPETGEPGYYILGAKSFGRNSGFLLRDGHAQVRTVFAQLTGNRKLDHYAKKAA